MLKAYLILDFSIQDFVAFSEYIERIPAHIEKHSGKYIVKGTIPETMEGNWSPERIVVIEFPSRVQAKAFLDDPEAAELFAIRHRTTSSQLILVDAEQ